MRRFQIDQKVMVQSHPLAPRVGIVKGSNPGVGEPRYKVALFGVADARWFNESELVAATPYEPRIDYRCDDYDCCPNGCPVVYCLTCFGDWPCEDYRAAHTEAQISSQERWTQRVWDRGM